MTPFQTSTGGLGPLDVAGRVCGVLRRKCQRKADAGLHPLVRFAAQPRPSGSGPLHGLIPLIPAKGRALGTPPWRALDCRAAATPGEAMAKTIIFCADGTWNGPGTP